jgi:hypothetical protein
MPGLRSSDIEHRQQNKPEPRFLEEAGLRVRIFGIMGSWNQANLLRPSP